MFCDYKTSTSLILFMISIGFMLVSPLLILHMLLVDVLRSSLYRCSLKVFIQKFLALSHKICILLHLLYSWSTIPNPYLIGLLHYFRISRNLKDSPRVSIFAVFSFCLLVLLVIPQKDFGPINGILPSTPLCSRYFRMSVIPAYFISVSRHSQS